MTNNNLLIDNYIFYEKHHQHKLNVLLHIICIPILTWTAAVFLSYIPIEYQLLDSEDHLIKPIVINATSVVTFCYLIYYFYLDYRLGKIWSVLFCIICYTANLYRLSYPDYALRNCIYLHIGSWILQLLSHKYIEGNKPALLTGLVQSFTIAPFFTLLEYLFMVGARKDLYNKIQLRKKYNLLQPR
jgi:uncharacterized membrane protein YGL010W